MIFTNLVDSLTTLLTLRSTAMAALCCSFIVANLDRCNNSVHPAAAGAIERIPIDRIMELIRGIPEIVTYLNNLARHFGSCIVVVMVPD